MTYIIIIIIIVINIIMVSCMILKGQCVVGIPNNQVLISIIIRWQVLGRHEGTTHISDGKITQNQPVLSSTAGI